MTRTGLELAGRAAGAGVQITGSGHISVWSSIAGMCWHDFLRFLAQMSVVAWWGQGWPQRGVY